MSKVDYLERFPLSLLRTVCVCACVRAAASVQMMGDIITRFSSTSFQPFLLSFFLSFFLPSFLGK